MSLQVKRPKGTQDVLPADIMKWRTVEATVSDTAEQFGFREIRTPVFEDTALYVRSVGDTSDVVTKEMYTVSSKGDATFTLRPEGTAGVVRAMLENGMMNEGFPQKVYYIIPAYRHEKPQAGRLREFHQFGVEMFGTQSPYADAEIILLAAAILDGCGLENVAHLNSIGCPECRAKYREALRGYFAPHREELCETCRERLEKNPMRLLDCKSPICREIASGAPVILDYLCDGCREHFEELKSILDDYGIKYEVGGQPVPALGFGMGLERLIMTMESCGCAFEPEKTPDLYIAPMGDAARRKAALLADAVRQAGYAAETDLVGRGLKPQMRYADKIGAKFVVVIGDNELETGEAKLKNMRSGEETPVKLSEFMNAFSSELINEVFENGLGDEIAGAVTDEIEKDTSL